MGRAIQVQLYRIEVGSDGSTQFVTMSYPDTLATDEIMNLVPVNVQGGQDLRGLGWLYSKFTLKQPGIDQEFFVMNSVLDLRTQWNS